MTQTQTKIAGADNIQRLLAGSSDKLAGDRSVSGGVLVLNKPGSRAKMVVMWKIGALEAKVAGTSDSSPGSWFHIGAGYSNDPAKLCCPQG